MTRLPTAEENPNGLHQRYAVRKICTFCGPSGEVSGVQEDPGFASCPRCGGSHVMPYDPDAEYFVLRLDSKGDDPAHIDACRAAAACYAHRVSHLSDASPTFKKVAEELLKHLEVLVGQ